MLVEAILRRAKFNRADLSHAQLTGADLVEAKLRGATLRSTDLCWANLRGADLYQANLAGAQLRGANLVGANLTEANLGGANLVEANFSHATLRRANMHGATFAYTLFGNTDLADVKELDQCQHLGPSVVDHQTLANVGILPLAFLRGCGLPDLLIDYLPSLLNQPIRFFSCFISYSNRDHEFAERLYADLQNNGVRCWFAPEDLKIGDRFRQSIDEAIHIHDRLLLILSEDSVQSNWVRDEVETGLEREDRERRTLLFPVRLDDEVMNTSEAWAASIRRQRHIGDFRKWKDFDTYQNAFRRLLRDLKPVSAEGKLAESELTSPD